MQRGPRCGGEHAGGGDAALLRPARRDVHRVAADVPHDGSGDGTRLEHEAGIDVQRAGARLAVAGGVGERAAIR